MYLSLLLLTTCFASLSFGVEDSKVYFKNGLNQHKIKNENEMIHSITKVAIDLNREISRLQPNENVIFSPVNIVSALAALSYGAKGYTMSEFSRFFGVYDYNRLKLFYRNFGSSLYNLVGQHKEGYSVDAAIGVFPDYYFKLNINYAKDIHNLYNAEIRSLDYRHTNEQAKAVINNWVQNKTHGNIKRLLEKSPSPYCNLVLASALYFKGSWKYPFDKNAIKRMPFYSGMKSANHKEAAHFEVDFMVGTETIPYLNDQRFQAIGLPYSGEEVYMYIVLPEHNIDDLIKHLKEDDLHSIISSTVNTLVIYGIPKMELEDSVDLTNVLRNLGIKSAFDPVRSDFTGIADGKMALTEVIHKVNIDINEEGTTASAATSATSFKSGDTPVFRVDRPFLFFIHHKKTDSILFWGKIVNPTPNFKISKQSKLMG